MSIFSGNVIRWEAMAVPSADNVIMWEVVVGGFADDAPAKCVVGSGAFGGVAEGYCGGGVAFGDMIADGSWWQCKDRGRSRLCDGVFLRICLLMGFETFVFVVFSLSGAHLVW